MPNGSPEISKIVPDYESLDHKDRYNRLIEAFVKEEFEFDLTRVGAQSFLENTQEFFGEEDLPATLRRARGWEKDSDDRKQFEGMLLKFLRLHLKFASEEPSQEVFSTEQLKYLGDYFVESEKTSELSNEIRREWSGVEFELGISSEGRKFLYKKREVPATRHEFKALQRQYQNLSEFVGTGELPKRGLPKGVELEEAMAVLRRRMGEIEVVVEEIEAGISEVGFRKRAEAEFRDAQARVQEEIARMRGEGAEVMAVAMPSEREFGLWGRFISVESAKENREYVLNELELMGPDNFIRRYVARMLLDSQAFADTEMLRERAALTFPEILAQGELDAKALFDGAKKISQCVFEHLATGIGGVEDIARRIPNLLSDEYRKLIEFRMPLQIMKIEGGQWESLGEVSIARALDLLEHSEYNGGYFTTDGEKVGETKTEIAKALLAEAGLPEGTEFFKVNWVDGLDRQFTSYDQLVEHVKFAINGADGLVYAMAAIGKINPEITARWLYALRNAQRSERYRQMYAIESPWENFFFDGKFRDFEGENAKKMIGLLNERFIKNPDGYASKAPKRKEREYMEARMRYLEYIILDEPLPPECKPAMVLLLRGEGSFESPYNEKTYNFSSLDERIQFLQDHRRGRPAWVSTQEQMLAKFNALIENARTKADLEKYFGNFDFSGEIDRMVKKSVRLKGKVPEQKSGTEALRWIFENFSKEHYYFDKLVETDPTKEWRYLDALAKTFGVGSSVFEAATVVLREVRLFETTGDTVDGHVRDAVAAELGGVLKELKKQPAYADHLLLAELIEDRLDGVLTSWIKTDGLFPAVCIAEDVQWSVVSLLDFSNLKDVFKLQDIMKSTFPKKDFSGQSAAEMLNYARQQGVDFYLEAPTAEQLEEAKKLGFVYRNGFYVGPGGDLVYGATTEAQLEKIASSQKRTPMKTGPMSVQYKSRYASREIMLGLVHGIGDARVFTAKKVEQWERKIEASKLPRSVPKKLKE